MHNRTMKTLLTLLMLFSPASTLFAEEVGIPEADSIQRHELLKTVWRVESIKGEPVVEDSRTEISFFEEGRIAATVGCNRIGGGVILGEGTIQFGPLMMTRMACEEPLMNQEHRFTEAISESVQYQIKEEGKVMLFFDESEKPILRFVKPEVPKEKEVAPEYNKAKPVLKEPAPEPDGL